MRVTNADTLAQQVIRILNHPDDGVQIGQLAQHVIRQNQGALQRTLDAIETLLAQGHANNRSSLERRTVPLMVGR